MQSGSSANTVPLAASNESAVLLPSAHLRKLASSSSRSPLPPLSTSIFHSSHGSSFATNWVIASLSPSSPRYLYAIVPGPISTSYAPFADGAGLGAIENASPVRVSLTTTPRSGSSVVLSGAYGVMRFCWLFTPKLYANPPALATKPYRPFDATIDHGFG